VPTDSLLLPFTTRLTFPACGIDIGNRCVPGKLGSPSPIETIWLLEQFEKLHNEHLLILRKIDEIQTTINPALEKQVRLALTLATKVDQKVPDINVPPSTKP